MTGTTGLLTLLTDFGTDDYYVAAVKGTVLRLAPGTTLVDVSHGVAPGDVETAGHFLAAAAPSFPAGTLHLAVVDPGVGTPRRILALATPEARFLAPDNGLLSPLIEAAPADALQLRSVERPDLYLETGGSTFHGRDRFAPVAAYLLRGGAFDALGPEIADPILAPTLPPQRQGDELRGRVRHIDRFGNLVTDLPSAWLPEGVPFLACVNGHEVRLRVSCYGEIPSAEPAILPGSQGTLELSLNRGDLAAQWQVARGAEVRVRLQPPTATANSR